ncbi:hypothetical protein BCR43DRAFT_101606 [Syncephalastrum racemosum]|uniref:Tudor domain-containing protein n=1 Tax=Syncephalastrum racemosum TaxID=13706 RepID=A0A1X2H1F3_SYNRA|nr:hypothetical protein BCR43DRAFT_101606 [Syncephalastrum racemosum]
MSDDTESYQYQLEQVELALSKDPDNEELKKLQHDLKELIALTSQLEQQQQKQKKKSVSPSASPVDRKGSSPSTPTGGGTTAALKAHEFSVGQEVLARWSGDGQFYRATITAIGGADQVFSVVFKGYQDNEMVKAEDVKALHNKKRQGIFEDVVVKKPKKEKTPGQPKKKVHEEEVKKSAWLNFASGGDKGKKKKMVAAPINKKSIFKTPDNPQGKVGVVGSGQGMTAYNRRGKHQYNATEGADNEE